MSELKRTVLYQAHLDAGATMVDFGGWDMPIQYPDGIVAEHLYCRSRCAIFDVSHMGRIDVEGPDMVRFLQHVLSSNVQALDINQAQYCIISNQNGTAILIGNDAVLRLTSIRRSTASFPIRMAVPSTTRISIALRQKNTSSSSMRATSTRISPT